LNVVITLRILTTLKATEELSMILFLFFAAVLTVLVCAAMAKRSADFENRYPPISDAEFLARCSPGVNPDVALKVRRIVAEYFAIDSERVYPSMTFVEDLGAD
jgi:hypothetical protein